MDGWMDGKTLKEHNFKENNNNNNLLLIYVFSNKSICTIKSKVKFWDSNMIPITVKHTGADCII